jgi:hypothetical protein
MIAWKQLLKKIFPFSWVTHLVAKRKNNFLVERWQYFCQKKNYAFLRCEKLKAVLEVKVSILVSHRPYCQNKHKLVLTLKFY